jgi:ketosteroid isomerase-like protein
MIREAFISVVGLLFATLALAQTPPARTAEDTPPPSVTLPPELARVLTDYEKAWRAHDAAGLVALFAEDGFVLSAGAPPVRGRAAIAKAYAHAGGELVLRAFAFATEGPLGYIVGGFSRREGQPDVGKFTLTLRRGSDGRWLIVSDMDNGNARP